MDPEKFDVAVIGGGPGGYVSAIRAARLGGKVALIERSELGGTCLNRGCIPTKTLIHGANLFTTLKSSQGWGIEIADMQLNMEKLIAQKDRIVKSLKQGIEKLIEANKIRFFIGHGQLIDNKKIAVKKEKEVIEIEAENIILATGSKPSVPPIPGVNNEGVITSDEALKMVNVPGELVIVGAGVIGLEFACLFAYLGANVTVLEAQDEILPMVDNEIVKRVVPIWKKQGVKIEKPATVQSILKSNGKLLVEYANKKGNNQLICDNVLLAAGRKPYIGKEVLGDVKIDFEKQFVKVNEKMQTSIPNIYAIGDIVNSPMLAHIASAEGIIAAENARGYLNMIDYDVIPGCIFSSPEIAYVGLKEEEAKAKYEKIKVAKIPFSSNGRVLTLGEQVGMLKMIMDEKTKKIVGAHVFGYMASELIAEITLAMENQLTADDIANTVHSHPSLSELIQEAAHVLMNSPIHTI